MYHQDPFDADSMSPCLEEELAEVGMATYHDEYDTYWSQIPPMMSLDLGEGWSKSLVAV